MAKPLEEEKQGIEKTLKIFVVSEMNCAMSEVFCFVTSLKIPKQESVSNLAKRQERVYKDLFKI